MRRRGLTAGTLAVGSFVVVLLASAPGVGAVIPNHVWGAPYLGIHSSASHTGSISGCSTGAHAKRLHPASFNRTTGVVTLGSAAAAGSCGGAPGTARASETLVLAGPHFRVAKNGSFAAGELWNLTFTFGFNDSCSTGCNTTNYGVSSYTIRINVSIVDVTTGGSTPLGTYLNTTTNGGSVISVTYRDVIVTVAGTARLLTTDHYAFRTTVAEVVIASAAGPSGKAATTLDLAKVGTRSWLASLWVV